MPEWRILCFCYQIWQRRSEGTGDIELGHVGIIFTEAGAQGLVVCGS